MRLVPSGANLQPTFAVYARPVAAPAARYEPLAIKALTLDAAGAIREITGFTDPGLFPYFGLESAVF